MVFAINPAKDGPQSLANIQKVALATVLGSAPLAEPSTGSLAFLPLLLFSFALNTDYRAFCSGSSTGMNVTLAAGGAGELSSIPFFIPDYL